MKCEYGNEKLTIMWQSEKCMHSKYCVRGLPDVFNIENSPWINIEGASLITIKNVIDSCPSGALSYKPFNLNQ